MRTKIVSALAVAALSSLVPGAISGGSVRVAADDPTVPVTIQVLGPQKEQGGHASAPKSVARAEPVRNQAPAAEVEEAEVIEAPAADAGPPGVIREWHIMYAQPGSSGEPSNAGPCPRASTCDRNQVRAARWPTDDGGRAVIPFAYSDEGRRPARAGDGIARPSLTAAMAEWSRWNSNIVFRDEGTTTATFGADGPDGTCADGTNVVTWGKFDPNVIGAAVLCFDSSGKVIRDADLALNSTQHWERVSGEPESRHAHDIQSIYTHELGHWLALEDIYSPDSARQTMHGSTEYGQTRKRSLALGDIVGVQKAYPCGAGDRCPRSGITDD